MTRACAGPIPFARLIEYWFGELPAEAGERIEEHLLACGQCSAELETLALLYQGVGAVFESGAIHAAISAAFVTVMKERGMRLREYVLAPGESVHCTIAKDDDAVIGRLKAPLAGAGRVDMLATDDAGALLYRFDDIPYDPAAGEVLFCPPAAALKKMPAYTERVRLLATGPEGERAIADYTFVHEPA